MAMDLALVLTNSAFYVDEGAIDASIAEARGNGHQEDNLNVGYHCNPEELNLLHPFWAGADDPLGHLQGSGDNQNRVTFGEKILAKPVKGHNVEAKEEDVDFVERGERALCKVVKIVEASFKMGESIVPILLDIKDESIKAKVGETLLDIIAHLEKGKNYSFNNCSSLRVKYTGTNIALNNIARAYTVFQYFTGSTQMYFPTSIKKDEIVCTTRPKLVRQASRSVYCCQR